MKTFKFDVRGNLAVLESVEQVADGVTVTNTSQHEIQPGQLEAHLPMFEADMTPEQIAQAQAIIAAQGGA